MMIIAAFLGKLFLRILLSNMSVTSLSPLSPRTPNFFVPLSFVKASAECIPCNARLTPLLLLLCCQELHNCSGDNLRL